MVKEAKAALAYSLFSTTLFDSEIETFETAFGDIKAHEDAPMQDIKDGELFLEISTGEIDLEDLDDLDKLVYLEKLCEKFPDEPTLNYGIADCYGVLGEAEKLARKQVENYERFSGVPLVDFAYFTLLATEKRHEPITAYFSKGLNPHNVYPWRKAFSDEEVLKFYILLANLSIEKKDFQVAKQCIEVVARFHRKKALEMGILLRWAQQPWRRRLTIACILTVAISLVGGVIWGLVRLFQWIF